MKKEVAPRLSQRRAFALLFWYNITNGEKIDNSWSYGVDWHECGRCRFFQSWAL